jgi:hypothetical protein
MIDGSIHSEQGTTEFQIVEEQGEHRAHFWDIRNGVSVSTRAILVDTDSNDPLAVASMALHQKAIQSWSDPDYPEDPGRVEFSYGVIAGIGVSLLMFAILGLLAWYIFR